MNIEYPPILTGSTDKKLNALRDYLVRLAQRLNEQEDSHA